MITSGQGLEYLTRGLAIARQLRRLDPEMELAFVTTSLATEVIREHRWMFYYLPSHDILLEKVTRKRWEQYLESQLVEIINIHHPIGLVYVGAHPEEGVMNVLNQRSLKKRVWIKDEEYKEELDQLEGAFDLVILPKEFSLEQGKEKGRRRVCEPIMLLEAQEAHEREPIRKSLQIKPEEKLLYVQLGSGRNLTFNAQLQYVLEGVIQNPQYKVLLGESMIGPKIKFEHPQVIKIRSYPNAQYFKGIDGAISLAGYNTFHELLYFGVPSLFILDEHTPLDDQVKRVQEAVNERAALSLGKVDQESVQKALEKLIRQGIFLGRQGKKLVRNNGARQAARYILEYILGVM